MNRRPSGYEPDELPNCSIPRPDALFKSMSLAFKRLIWSDTSGSNR
ncbi:hypothetical protein VCRA219O171_60001 [Vibrio crassostreae]|nr:hypothetical protein VCRA219O171_60001 [Vibrio crassostreae]